MSDLPSHSILILGGCGFIGSHVVDRFIASGHAVRVLDIQAERYREAVPGVDYRFGDFGNRGLLGDAMQGVDVVIHLVSSTIPKTSNDDPVFDIQSNLVESVACLQQCLKARIRKVIFLSSGGAVYGNPADCPVSEEAPTNPLCSYGVVKLAIEKYLDLFRSLHGLNYAVVRASNPFGPRQNPFGGQGVIPAMLTRIALNRPIEIWGDGSVVRDFIYVGDLADAIYAATFDNVQSRVFNVGSGTGLSLLEVIAKISLALDIQPSVNFLPGRPFDVQRIYLDVSRARRELNWIPRTSLEDALWRTWAFVQEAVKLEPPLWP
jgi:UDP-glucose 4-epimerase